MTAEKSSGLRYAVIGAGMAGILAGIKLKQSGEDFTIFEKAATLGGTWRENRYPGLTCDVPAHAYTYSFEPYAEWQAYYAKGGEIQNYFLHTADKYGVSPHIHYNSEVVSCVWDSEAAQWTLRLVNGDSYIADVVIAASGVLHHPNTPDIPGLSTFEGKAFHSARWDDSAKIDGARVGIIGNGSTGVQIVTALAERSAKVEIASVVLSVTGGRLGSESFAASVRVPGSSVEGGDIARVLDAASMLSVRDGRAVLHSIPIAYHLDDVSNIQDPRGMLGGVVL